MGKFRITACPAVVAAEKGKGVNEMGAKAKLRRNPGAVDVSRRIRELADREFPAEQVRSGL